jgi:hypothetical protein
MFATAASLGGLAIQLCYFRGFGEFQAAPWLTDANALIRRMTSVNCQAGTTQIARVLRHAISEAEAVRVNAIVAGRVNAIVAGRVNAIVYIGDSMEESADSLIDLAGKLALLGIPAFVFQEGEDNVARQVFQQLAHITQGAYARFDGASAKTLRDLLMAVAVYAAGGRRALADYAEQAGSEVARLTRQLR